MLDHGGIPVIGASSENELQRYIREDLEFNLGVHGGHRTKGFFDKPKNRYCSDGLTFERLGNF